LHQLALDVVPPFAALDLISVGPFVQAALAARFEFEMLHRVGDEDLCAVQARFGNGPVQHPPGGADEGVAVEVFVVAGLLSDHHQRRVLRSFAGDDLGCRQIQRAAGALRFGFAQAGERAREGGVIHAAVREAPGKGSGR
jgi:hypothetical protein